MKIRVTENARKHINRNSIDSITIDAFRTKMC
jgi:hypothetical protein